MTTQPPTKQKSFKEVLDDHIGKMPPNIYFRLIEAHNQEMQEIRDAHIKSLEKVRDSFNE